MNYWSRVTIPSTFSDAAAAFDQMVVDTFCQRMKLPSLSDVALSQLRLPVRLGGFGLSQLSLVSSAAWYCAFANAFRLIFPLIPSWEDLSLNTPFVSAMYTVYVLFRNYKFPSSSVVSASADNFWTDFEHKGCPSGSQRVIMTVINNQMAKELLNEFKSGSIHRARLISLAAPYAGAWLTTPPMDPLFVMNDTHFSLAVRGRLGLPPSDDILHCSCGASLTESPLHFHSCRSLGASRIRRHNRVVNLITSVARLCSIASYTEPRIDDRDRSRGDGQLFFHSHTAIFDVCIVNPCTPTMVKAAQRPLGAAVAKEKLKNDTYLARCREQGHLFFPTVLESVGALGVYCRDLVAKIEEEGALNGVKTIHGFKVRSFLLRALSFNLQSGNAMMAIDGITKARQRLWVRDSSGGRAVEDETRI